MSSSRPKVVIVGGGIGGLFAANALVAQGLRVNVYEQAPALGEVGAGVYITPNCVLQLQRVGLGPAVEKWGGRVGAASAYFRHDGSPIAPVQVSTSGGWSANYGMHRADLVAMLAAALPEGVVKTGHRCSGFERDGERARVTFENGASAEADVVIGADGIHSVMRPYVHPDSNRVYSGTVTYRGIVRTEHVPEWPSEAWLMWLGKGKHFLTYPMRGGSLINFVGFVTSGTALPESWSTTCEPAEVRREFDGWDRRIGYLLSHVDTVFRTALYDRDPLPTWTRGRLTLLGDAAHAMLPHLGQGANQSIEDGMALATILANTDRKTALAGLLLYERLRRERTAFVQTSARANGMRYESADADLKRRDAEIAAHTEFRKGLYDYDVVPYARAVAQDLV